MLWVMSDKREKVEAVVSYLLQGPERSTLFWWLVEHHDELIEAKGRKRTRWAPLAAQLAGYGLTNRNKQPASPAVVRQTWQRVRRYMAEEKEAKAVRQHQRRQQPSHLPATWRPPVAPLSPACSSDGPSNTAADLSGAEANLASIRAFIKSRSG